MSILDEIQRRCEESPPRLIKLTVSAKDPGTAFAPTPRTMFITPAIQNYLDSDAPLAEAARADLERFILGKLVVASLYRDHKDGLIARLDKPKDEIWEIRILDSDPQLRIFGRFACPDVFVALVGPIEHEFVETDEEYEEYKTNCMNDWLNLFGFSPSISIIGSNNINDYISNPVRLV